MNEDIEELLYREKLTLASIKKRATAFFIDELLLSLLLIVVLWDSFAASTNIQDTIALTNTFLLEFIAIKIAYQTFFVMQYGGTLGKIFMHIRVIEIKSVANPTILCSFNRATFRVISEMMFYIGFFWGIMTPERRTWHDLSSKTLVVDV
ncbi:MAG: RDD family protein [Helicobacteraceae bacterium]|nr:RDD family protein [Helicobacteraceae bacterium]